MCRMFDWVSVITIEFPAALATKVACGEMNVDRSFTSWSASTKRMGMIWVTISSFLGIRDGSLLTFTGMSRVLAVTRSTTVRVRPSRIAASPFLLSTEFSRSTASSRVTGLLLMMFTVPLAGVSRTMMNPAASLRYSSTSSSGALRKFSRISLGLDALAEGLEVAAGAVASAWLTTVVAGAAASWATTAVSQPTAQAAVIMRGIECFISSPVLVFSTAASKSRPPRHCRRCFRTTGRRRNCPSCCSWD